MQRKNRWFIGVILIISLLTILFLQYQSKIRRKGIHTTTDKFVIPKGTIGTTTKSSSEFDNSTSGIVTNPFLESAITTDFIPISKIPKKQEWRMGFRGEKDIYFIELLPKSAEICDEKRRMMRNIPRSVLYPSKNFHSTAVLFPFSIAETLGQIKILNPKKRTIIDMQNNIKKTSFIYLTAIYTEAHSGCWYMGSESLKEKNQHSVSVDYIKDNNIIFAIAGKPLQTPEIHLPIKTLKKNKDSYPNKDDELLMNRFEELIYSDEIRNVLGEEFEVLSEVIREIDGQAIKTIVDKRKGPEILWLVNWYFYSYSGQPDGIRLVGIFKEEKNRLRPMFISNPGRMNDYYSWYYARLISAVDLDGDGIDELVISAGYYEGGNYKVFKLKDNKFIEVL